MERSNNAWLESNKRKLDNVKKMITELGFMDINVGSTEGALNLVEVNWLFEGAVQEILKLQKEVDKLGKSGKQG
jgi:hypothetical protein